MSHEDSSAVQAEPRTLFLSDGFRNVAVIQLRRVIDPDPIVGVSARAVLTITASG